MSDPKMVTRSDAGGTRMEHWSLFSSSGEDPLLSVSGTAINTPKSGKPTFDFPRTGRSQSRPETRKLSPRGDNQFSQ